MAISGHVIERSDEAIMGWRTWNLSDDASAPRLLPAGSGVGDAWPPLQAMTARCGVPSILKLGRRRHDAPDIDCRCGVYASRSLEAMERPRPAWPPPCVVGTVALWGTVIEHERGWRGRSAYPARLRLVCSMCAWFEPGPGHRRRSTRSRGVSTRCATFIVAGSISPTDGGRVRPVSIRRCSRRVCSTRTRSIWSRPTRSFPSSGDDARRSLPRTSPRSVSSRSITTLDERADVSFAPDGQSSR